MAKVKQSFNPFYAGLVLLGAAFTVTACAYAVMTYRALDVRLDDGSDSGFMSTLDQYGAAILAIEVLLLGVATLGAIGLDQYRLNRAERESNGSRNSQALARGMTTTETDRQENL
jgi:hypothetical protein